MLTILLLISIIFLIIFAILWALIINSFWTAKMEKIYQQETQIWQVLRDFNSIKLIRVNAKPEMNEVLNDFLGIEREFYLPPGLLVAMSSLESNYCTSRLAVKNKNCFGINHGLKKYNSFQASARDAARIITLDPRYSKFQKSGYQDIDALGRVWAEDPLWATKIKWIIENLKVD